MRSLLVVAFGFLLTALTQAQSLAGLPACAENCALNAIGGSGCPVTNTTCICTSKTFISSYTTCVGSSCNTTDAASAQAFGIQYCAGAGVTIVASSPAATATGTTAASATSVPAATATVSTSATSAPAGTTSASKTASASVQASTGAAGELAYSWTLLGIGGAVALGLWT